MGKLKDIFSPDTVAIIGASEEKDSVGRTIMENIHETFQGEIIPVNPEDDSILGYKCYPDIESVSTKIDLAVIVVPPDIVQNILEDIGKTDIKDVVVITAGFSEIGPKGAKRQERLEEIAEKHDINLVGPNCLGVINTSNGLNVTFAPEKPLSGNISLMSQSGAFITAVLDWGSEKNVGFNDIVSLGNEAVLDGSDFVEEWGSDPETDVILGYIEQVIDGRKFIDISREVIKTTPIVILKSGKTEKGAKAAASHTGSMVGSNVAYKAGFKQAGVIQVDNIEELFDFGKVLSSQPVLSTDKIAIITNAGGPGVLAADEIDNSKLELTEFTENTKKSLNDILPSNATINNPLDIIGDADADRFDKILDIVFKDPNIEGILVIACPTGLLDLKNLAEKIVGKKNQYDKSLLTCFMGAKSTTKAEDILEDKNIPNFFNPKRAIRGLDSLARYTEIKECEYDKPKKFDVDKQKANKVLKKAKKRGTEMLGLEAMELLDAYGINTPMGEVVDNKQKAKEVAKKIDGAVVMKLVSPDITHKSDIGGVEIGVNYEDVSETFELIKKRAYDHKPNAEIFGVHIQEMVDTEVGQETLVGMKRDPQFGPLLAFGFGGIFVQIFEDITFRVAPVTRKEAKEMTEDIKSSQLLRGARGREPLDIDGLIESVQRLSQLSMDFPEIQELDINPIVALPDKVYAIDLRLTVNLSKID